MQLHRSVQLHALSEWQEELTLTWEGKDNVEACGPDEGRKPALPSIQQHQHQPCVAQNSDTDNIYILVSDSNSNSSNNNNNSSSNDNNNNNNNNNNETDAVQLSVS